MRRVRFTTTTRRRCRLRCGGLVGVGVVGRVGVGANAGAVVVGLSVFVTVGARVVVGMVGAGVGAIDGGVARTEYR